MVKIKTKVETQAPSSDDLFSCTDAVSVYELVESPQIRFNHAILTVLPPVLFVSYLELETRDHAELLTETVSIINMYAEIHKDDDEAIYPRAKEQCKYVLRFLWAVKCNRTPQLTCIADSDDTELVTWSKIRHMSCLLPTSSTPFFSPQHANLPGLPLPPLGVNADSMNAASDIALHELSGNIMNQTELLEKMRQDRTDENKKKNHKFDSLHESTKRLILNASSFDGESIPTIPEDTCKIFYSNTTVGRAMDYLTMTLKEKFKCMV